MLGRASANVLATCLVSWSLVDFLALKFPQKFMCHTAAWCLRQVFSGSLRGTHPSRVDIASCHTLALALETIRVSNLVYLTSGIEGGFLCQIPQESHAR